VSCPLPENLPWPPIIGRMDRYTQFGLRGDADEQLRRAVRDGFKRAGLSHAQLTQAMDWYRDHVRPGMHEAKLAESFAEFAAIKRWGAEQRDAAVSVYGQVRDQGPAAVMSPAPSAEEDAATIARASELLRTDPNAYWRDAELQEAQFEALERQEAAPTAEPPTDHMAIERRVSQQHVDRFATMLREEPEKYWRSPELQQQHRDAIAGTLLKAPAGEQPGPAAPADPGQAAVPGPADGGAVRV
jgi:hypothetical protein